MVFFCSILIGRDIVSVDRVAPDILRKPCHNKDIILSDMDAPDYEDKHYQRRKADLENHLYKTYDKIDEAEELLISAKTKKRALLADKITGDRGQRQDQATGRDLRTHI